ncbi:hypothetical protein ACFYPK_07435 [Streptomyces halstedii]|uniref:hypothetical protein n=1 Tax=Streptomyces halstedii TaxID=1944 RepID=UPI00367D5383
MSYAFVTVPGLDIIPGDILKRLPGVQVVSKEPVDPRYPHSQTMHMADGSLYLIDPAQEYIVVREVEPEAPACIACGATDGPMISIDAHTVACRASCTPLAATSPMGEFECAHCFEECGVDEMQLAKSGGDWWPVHRGCVDEARRAGHKVITA